MPERLDHVLSIARCASRNNQPNDRTQLRTNREAGWPSAAAPLGGDSREGELMYIRAFAGVFYGDSDDVARGV